MLPDRIASDARAVAQLAAYLAELKERAARLPQQVHAARRGYFTPSEDEQVRQLLVSYWQTREALFEIVTAYRQDERSLDERHRPAAFLVAFAAAVLLVDAARFLRETCDGSAVVVAKLNEPEPHFGIPAGVYDQVQTSLTSLRHAWRLWHARHYFSEHRAELAALAVFGAEPLLAPVYDIIACLGHRLAVSLAQHAEARWEVRSRRALDAVRRDVFGQLLYNLQEWGSCLASDVHTRAGHQPGLPPPIAAALREALRPGDVLIVRKEHALTNYFLPGYWPHAALCLGAPAALERLGLREHAHLRPRWARLLEPGDGADDEPQRALEALKDGVRIRSLRSPLASDAVAVVRPRLSEGDIARALARGLFHEGKPYDFDFDFTRSDRLVCTEVVYRSYEGIGGVRFELTRRAGRLTLAAEDLLAMALGGEHFELAAVYAPGHTRGLAWGGAAEAALRRTMC